MGRVSPAQGKWGVLVRDSQRLQNLFMKGVSRLCFADQGSTRFQRISGPGLGVGFGVADVSQSRLQTAEPEDPRNLKPKT